MLTFPKARHRPLFPFGGWSRKGSLSTTGLGKSRVASRYSLQDEDTPGWSSEREPVDSVRDKSNAIAGWLPSLTALLGTIMIDCIRGFAFLAALALPPVYFAVVRRKWPQVGMVSLAVYLISYLPLTLSGVYTVANHGGSDWRREWLPRFLVVEYAAPTGRTRTHMTIAGALYWPCILADRFLWHRTAAVEI
jgi:hypothetical protein